MRCLGGLPRHGNPVASVWARLAELEAAGQDERLIAALRSILVRHQPPRYGRCPACPRAGWFKFWQRRPWPCGVWVRVHFALLGRGELEL